MRDNLIGKVRVCVREREHVQCGGSQAREDSKVAVGKQSAASTVARMTVLIFQMRKKTHRS